MITVFFIEILRINGNWICFQNQSLFLEHCLFWFQILFVTSFILIALVNFKTPTLYFWFENVYIFFSDQSSRFTIDFGCRYWLANSLAVLRINFLPTSSIWILEIEMGFRLPKYSRNGDVTPLWRIFFVYYLNFTRFLLVYWKNVLT